MEHCATTFQTPLIASTLVALLPWCNEWCADWRHGSAMKVVKLILGVVVLQIGVVCADVEACAVGSGQRTC